MLRISFGLQLFKESRSITAPFVYSILGGWGATLRRPRSICLWLPWKPAQKGLPKKSVETRSERGNGDLPWKWLHSASKCPPSPVILSASQSTPVEIWPRGISDGQATTGLSPSDTATGVVLRQALRVKRRCTDMRVSQNGGLPCWFSAGNELEMTPINQPLWFL